MQRNNADSSFLQVCHDAAQTISALGHAENALNLIAVVAILMLQVLCLSAEFQSPNLLVLTGERLRPTA